MKMEDNKIIREYDEKGNETHYKTLMDLKIV